MAATSERRRRRIGDAARWCVVCGGESTSEDLAELRGDSLKALLIFAAIVVFVLMCGLVQFQMYSPLSWSAAVLMALGTALASKVRRYSLPLGSSVFIISLSGAVMLFFWGYGLSSVPFLLALPVMFTGLLLGSGWMLVAVAIVNGVIAGVGSGVHGESLLSLTLLSPISFVCLTALASWLSNRNLYAALGWAWNGYRQARQNEEQLRKRQAELRRLLRALDEANYRIRSMIRELALAAERAEEALRLKQQFAANISHELRTPLNLIVGFSEMMFLSPESYGGVPLPPPYRGDVDAIYRSGQHLLSLIDDVLDLSQIEAGHMVLNREMVDLEEVIYEAVGIIDSLVESKGLDLQVKVADDVPLLYADRTRLRQVLLNLLNNSCRFTEEGGITIGVQVEEDEVVMRVADTGLAFRHRTFRASSKSSIPWRGLSPGKGAEGWVYR